MKIFIKSSLFILCLLLITTTGRAETLELDVAKDTFGGSNRRNRNSGGSPSLYMAHSPLLRTLTAFDLSGVTNRIIGAELVLQPDNTNDRPLNMVVCPMVNTAFNATWIEGSGALGARGRNALVGEATFSRSAFPDVPWESADGDALTGLEDERLWMPPAARLNGISWKAGSAITMPLNAVPLLEKIRESETPIITFGLWGTSGNGHYTFSSKESGQGASLVLTLEE